MNLRTGVAKRSLGKPDPVLHLLVGDRHEVWCSGAAGECVNTMLRRRCPACTALLKEGVEEEMYDPKDLEQWMASTKSQKARKVSDA